MLCVRASSCPSWLGVNEPCTLLPRAHPESLRSTGCLVLSHCQFQELYFAYLKILLELDRSVCFHQICKNFGNYFFKYFFLFPSVFFYFETIITYMKDWLVLSLRTLRLFSLFRPIFVLCVLPFGYILLLYLQVYLSFLLQCLFFC